ncbi:hypothetical protein ACQR1N_30970 [Bradyrhizobium sp. HKCCYLRH1073]|uniref:hypothetical protein n=1 Tax=unclassified Bradyrhizobium TaxID=2631580 RepID=UPI003EBAFDE0
MSEQDNSDGTVLINWLEVLEWAERVEENRRIHNKEEPASEAPSVKHQQIDQAAE